MRRKKVNKNIPKKGYKYTTMSCKCGKVVEVADNTASVICGRCAIDNDIKKFGLPAGAKPREVKSNEEASPRGWHFMKVYVDKKGNVFHRGIEQPELKDTMKATKIVKKEKKKKLNARQKSEAFAKVSAEINELRREIDKVIKLKKTRGLKKLETQVRKKRKELKKYL
jgi:hypothetical protein